MELESHKVQCSTSISEKHCKFNALNLRHTPDKFTHIYQVSTNAIFAIAEMQSFHIVLTTHTMRQS